MNDDAGPAPSRLALVVLIVLHLTAPLFGEDAPRPVSFTNDVMAVLGKSGCNSGACHGHASGKGGFKLSLRGYDPAADHAALVSPDAGRVDREVPDESKLLLKPTGELSHRGGRRFEKGSEFHKILKQWIAEGAKSDLGTAVVLKRIEVTPEFREMAETGLNERLTVRAQFADGRIQDVTDRAIYELSTEGVVDVTADGLVTGRREGEAAVLVRYLGQMALSRYLIVRPAPGFAWSDPPEHNFIDRHVFAKLKAIHVLPSDLATDAEFLRRVHFDTVGLPPSPEEVRAFLAADSAGKRSRKIDELLERDEFGESWSLYWTELSGTNESGDSARFKGLWLLSFWLRDAVNRNLPYDQFVRALVAGKGSSIDNPAITFSLNRLPKQEVVPQLFLGVRMECAQCHDHPFDVWKRSDYQALGEFFHDLGHKEMARDFWGLENHRFVSPEKRLAWERGKSVSLRTPDGQTVTVPAATDRRDVLVDWMFGPGKQQVARALVNRVWGRLLGRGIVDSVDDMRFSNPPVNEPLLAALADDFIVHGWDFKHLVRTILNSRTYQLSSKTNGTNGHEDANFSHAGLRRLSAEQLLDAVAMITEVPDDRPGAVPGQRAGQWPYAGGPQVLTLFGRPALRASPCECIRSAELTLPQVLHLMNGPTVSGKLGDESGALPRLLAEHATDEALVTELYIRVLNRPPTDREQQFSREHLTSGDARRAAAEDLMWALLTSQEFLFNH